jgi:cytochrome P450
MNPLAHMCAVTSLLEKATLDIVSLAVLGYKSNALSSKSSFAEAYKKVFELPLLGQIIAVIHQYVPVRTWLPLRVNREFVAASAQIRNLLREQIRERKIALAGKEKSAVTQKSRDLLTLMVEEKAGGVAPWSEEEMLNHVSTEELVRKPASLI